MSNIVDSTHITCDHHGRIGIDGDDAGHVHVTISNGFTEVTCRMTASQAGIVGDRIMSAAQHTRIHAIEDEEATA